MTADLVKRNQPRLNADMFDETGDANDFDPRDERIKALMAERDECYERWNDCQEKRMAAEADNAWLLGVLNWLDENATLKPQARKAVRDALTGKADK